MSYPSTSAVRELDCRGLRGAEPIVVTTKAAQELGEQGGVLRIVADDERFPKSLQTWCRATQAELVKLEKQPDGCFSALVQVRGRLRETGARAYAATVPVSLSGQGVASAAGRGALLDCRGLLCPEPITRLAKLARGLAPDSVLEVLADDAAFPGDVQSWCRSSGAVLVSLTELGGLYKAVIRTKPKIGAEAAPAEPAVRPHGKEGEPVRQDDTELDDDGLASTMEPENVGIRLDLSGQSREACMAILSSIATATPAPPRVSVTATHASFAQDIALWCANHGHMLLRLNSDVHPMVAEVLIRGREAGTERAVAKAPSGPLASAVGNGGPNPDWRSNARPPSTAPHFIARPHGESGEAASPGASANACALLVISGDLERMMVALMTANAAAASGMRVTVFFAFWALNLLRGSELRDPGSRPKVGLIRWLLKRLMPRGPTRQRLGRLSLGGAGALLVRWLFRQNRALVAEELIAEASSLGVQFLACSLTMGVMGITENELMSLPNLQIGGFSAFIGDAKGAGINFVF